MKAVYPSKYTERKVGPSQYLADVVMERIASKEKKSLPYKYWNNSEWKKQYLHQVTAAGKLLREHDCLSIMEFLRSPKGRNILSLGLRKQILDGVRALQKQKNISQALYEIEDGLIIDDIEEDAKSDEPKASLWEKL